MTSGNFYFLYNTNNIWVTGGSDTGLYYSTDGITWTQSNVTSGSFHSARNANGLWVAVSNLASYYSTDGMSWVPLNAGFVNKGRFVYNINGLWTICCTDAGLYYSTDGMTWTQSNVTNDSFQRVYCANNIWVAFGTGLYYSEGIPVEIEIT